MTPPPIWWAAMAALTGLAFALRVLVHAGRTPGGVDAWYYLAYARAFRRRRSLDVRLPQYLLQDERQSYPPLFPSLLGLLPPRLLERGFWAISPGIDCLHLLLLGFVAHRLTDEVGVAVLAAGAYAFTPHLVSETRSLTPRPFGALLNSLAMLVLLKAVVSPSGGDAWLAAAALAGSVVFLASAAMSAAYLLTCCVLALAMRDATPALVALAGLVLAFVLSGGHFGRVLANYAHAVRFWARNRAWLGAHPVRDSPVLAAGGGARGAASRRSSAARPGFLGASRTRQLLRLLGENPFLVALPLAPYGEFPYGPWLYVWALSLAALAVAATLVPLLSNFGPAHAYMRAAIFPTAYTLAFAIGTPRGLLRPVGLLTLAALASSIAGIGFFYWYVRSRATEQTANVPEPLRAAARDLAARPGEGVLVLPYMYADFVCHHSGKRVLWGGHSGDHSRLEAIHPLIREPLGPLLSRYGVRYLLLDEAYVSLDELGLGSRPRELARFGRIAVFESGFAHPDSDAATLG